MINLEQVKLLEAKVAKAIDYVERLTKENAALIQKEAEFQEKIDAYQGRIDELEVLLMRFKGDQGQIEESILAALDRLSRFEKEMEKSLKEKPSGFHAAATKAAARGHRAAAHHNAEAPDAAQQDAPHQEPSAGAGSGQDSPVDEDDAGKTCFEIPEGMQEDDIPDPLEQTDGEQSPDTSGSPAKDEELDIF